MIEFLSQTIDILEEDHPVKLLQPYHIRQIIRQIRLRAIDQFFPPFSPIETYRGQGRLLTFLYIHLLNRNTYRLKQFLLHCDIVKVRKLLWQRFTASSTVDTATFPPTKMELITKAVIDGVDNAIDYPVCDHQYWRTEEQVTFDIYEICDYFLEEYTWWNTYHHNRLGLIYEVRDRTGHGLRYSIDPLVLVELIEPDTDAIVFRSNRI